MVGSRNPKKDGSAQEGPQMGYPMAVGYPPAGYPSGGNYPASYYAAQEGSYGPRMEGSLFRGFILCICVLLLGMTIVTIVMIMTHRTEVPRFKLNSLSVSNMNTTGAFSGDWDAKVSVHNPNKVKMYFNNFHVQMFYKDNQIGSSLGSGFELDHKEDRQVSLKASSTPSNPVYLEKSRLEEMGKERGSGSVTFSLHIGTITTYRSGYMSSRTWQMEAKCKDVNLEFKKDANHGVSNNGDKPIDCTVY